ncbi:MAG: hypothetical protein AB4038_07100, partial [Prochloraceae cyanobacterium]
LYSFGVGSSTNRFLINRLAEVGRGTAEILPPNEPAIEVAREFFQEINNPVLTNVEVTWIGSGEKPEIYPLAAPDLFANQPLVLYGRKSDRASGKLKISGTVAGGKSYEKILNVNFDQVSGNSAIAQLWGRAKIKDLSNQMHWGKTPEKIEAVTNTALAYRLLSDYTSFVAVTEEVRVDPQDGSLKEEVAVQLPDGMNPKAVSPAKTSLSKPQISSYKSHKTSPSKPKSHSVPEPGQILGNLLAMLALILFFYWRGLYKSKNLPPNKPNK